MTTRPRYAGLIMDSARWDGFVFRPDDIIVTTPPKCGTTWTQMICALLVFQTPVLDRSLDLISPWLDMLTRDIDDVRADLAAQRHRRIIKTHTPLDGLPFDPHATYVVVGRDPRDVFFSWDNHLQNMNVMNAIVARAAAVGLDDIADLLAKGPPERPADVNERFRMWVSDETPITNTQNLAYTYHHLSTYWDARDHPNVVFLHYADMKRDLEGEMRRLAARLDIAVPDSLWPELVDAARFENMRASADTVAPDTTHEIWNDNRRFFNEGALGGWRDRLTAEDLKLYDQRAAQLASPDVRFWAENGGPVRSD